MVTKSAESATMTIEPHAFDAFAADYDDDFTETQLARWWRPRVWDQLAHHITEGTQVLELTCGTGADAVWMAQQGARVIATDGAPEMVATTAAKAAAFDVAAAISPELLTLQTLGNGEHRFKSNQFNVVLSNFGGLNTVPTMKPIFTQLAEIVRPTGVLVFVIMGPYCPWESVWHLGHGKFADAGRRLRKRPAAAKIGAQTIPIWYPSARSVIGDAGQWFRPIHLSSLGLWTPPSYLEHLVERFPRIFSKLNQIETKTASLTRGLGDHYILILKRKEKDSAA